MATAGTLGDNAQRQQQQQPVDHLYADCSCRLNRGLLNILEAVLCMFPHEQCRVFFCLFFPPPFEFDVLCFSKVWLEGLARIKAQVARAD